MKPDEYRKKHPRCGTCKYFVFDCANAYRDDRGFAMLKSD